MTLNGDNYYSQKANSKYMSVSQYKMFAGTYGRAACEASALAQLRGEWEEETNTAMMIGSYVDSYFEGTLDKFKSLHPEIFKRDGMLKAEYIKADQIIARAERDEFFMKYLSGEKQVIMTGEFGGCEWKIKMDSYIPGVAIVDLKVMSSITEMKWVKDHGYMDFIRYWGYDIQGAIYQEIVRQNTGKKLPFYIAALSKEKEPDIEVLYIADTYLKEALAAVETNLPTILQVKSGELEPHRCEVCDYCKHTKVLTAPIGIADILLKI